MFGMNKHSLFGSTSKPQAQTTSNLFGQQATGMSGSNIPFSGFQMNSNPWAANTNTNGTALAFNPPITTEVIQRSGQPSQVNAKHMCITAMKEYQEKSLEELRLEDYTSNRRGQSASSLGNSMFAGSSTANSFQLGSSQAAATSSLFGQTSKPGNSLFGGSTSGTGIFGSASATTQPTFGQAAQGSLLGMKPAFGAATSSSLFGSGSSLQSSSGISFGQSNQNTNVFGSKPLFGAASSNTTGGSSLFGSGQNLSQPGSTGFGFNQTQQVQTGLGGSTNLFGQSSLNAGAKSTGIFGSQAFGSSTQSTGMFGANKPAGTNSLFGASSPGLTGLQSSQPQTGFGFGAGSNAMKPSGSTLFGNTGTGTSTLKPGLFGNTGLSTGSTGFGFANASQSSSFGATSSLSGGLFGQGAGVKKPIGFGTALTSNAVSSATGGPFGFGQPSSTSSIFGSSNTAAGQTGFGLGAGSSLFGGQSGASTATGFGLGQKSLQTGVGFNNTGFGFGQSNSLFSNQTGNTLGSGLFGSGSTGGFGLGSATQNTGLGSVDFGARNQLALGSGGLGNNSTDQLAQNVRAQQQVLELVRSMPYGQSSLFRYMNLPTTTGASTAKEKAIDSAVILRATANGSNNVVIPARAMVNVLAERNKSSSLFVSSSPKGNVANGRGVNFGRPNSTCMFQMANRNKLFSGFYEDIPNSPTTLNRYSSGLRRAVSIGTNSLNDSPGFFVRREEWKRLHLPENIRTSILERSNAISNEFSIIAESNLNRTNQDNGGACSRNDGSGDNPLPPSDGCAPSGLQEPTDSNVASTSNTEVNSSNQLDNSVTNVLTSIQESNVSTQEAEEAFPMGTIGRDLDDTLASPANITFGDISVLTTLPDVTGLNQTTDMHQSVGQESSNPCVTSNDRALERAGIILTKPGYYTLPTLDELALSITADGSCWIEDFVVGRRHYGHILFPGLTNISGLNLNSIVHIRRREVVVYPDDDKKPPVGSGLNKQAEISLESIWPTDKSTHEPIKCPERLRVMRFEDRLEKATRRMDARFIEYRPDSGSWVFEVKHFSRYRLEDSDDEGQDRDKNSGEEHPTSRGIKNQIASRKGSDGEATLDEFMMLFRASMKACKELESDSNDANSSQLNVDDCRTDDVNQQQIRSDTYQCLYMRRNPNTEQNSSNPVPKLAYELLDEIRDLLPGKSKMFKKSLHNHSSRLILDFGLWQGYRLRPFFGYFRLNDLNAQVLIVSASNNDENHRNHSHCLTNSKLSFNQLPSFIEFFDEEMLNSALMTSTCIMQTKDAALHAPQEHCPVWYPIIGLSPLEAYTRVLGCGHLQYFSCDSSVKVETQSDLVETPRLNCFKRVFSFCQAAWGRHPQSAIAEVYAYSPLNRPEEVNYDELTNQTDVTVELLDGCLKGDGYIDPTDEEIYRTFNLYNYPLSKYKEHVGIPALARKQSVSEWIRVQSHPWLESELKRLNLMKVAELRQLDSNNDGSTVVQIPFQLDQPIDTHSIAQAIFACLVSGEPGVACRLAIAASMSALVSLVSQATSGDPSIHQGLKHQLNKWHELKYDQHIPLSLLRVYCLLAGLREFPHPHRPGEFIHVLAHLDWVQVFGVYLWYFSDYGANLSDVLKMYAQEWQLNNGCNSKFSIPRPLPPSVEKLTDLSKASTELNDFLLHCDRSLDDNIYDDVYCKWPKDTVYHLLQLVENAHHSLAHTLDPCSMLRQYASTCFSSSSNLLDWSLSWHLWRVLTAYGYRSSSCHSDDSCQSPIVSRICQEFASQLEGAGLWEWSVFVFLHLEDESFRENVVKTLIGRHVSLVPFTIDQDLNVKLVKSVLFGDLSIVPTPAFTKAENFVVNRLGVPSCWLHEAKAILAHSRLSFVVSSSGTFHQSNSWKENDHIRLLATLEASHWFAAGKIQAAIDVLMKYLLPDIVLKTSQFPPSGVIFNAKFQTFSELGRQLTYLIKPFSEMPESLLPHTYHSTIGVYLSYGELLCLVNHLTLYCNPLEDDVNSPDVVDDVAVESSSFSSTTDRFTTLLNNIRTKHIEFAEILQDFPTNTLLELAVKSEMTSTCVHLMSAFYSANVFREFEITKHQSECADVDPSNFLQQQISSIRKLLLPADYRLRQLRIIAEVKLSLGLA